MPQLSLRTSFRSNIKNEFFKEPFYKNSLCSHQIFKDLLPDLIFTRLNICKIPVFYTFCNFLFWFNDNRLSHSSI